MLGAPLCIEMDYVLELWLGTVPDRTTYFAQLALLTQLIAVVSIPLITGMLATGRIRNYQIIVGGIGILAFPATWILMELGFGPETPYLVLIVTYILQLAIRLYMLIGLIKLDVKSFITNVLLRCTVVGLLTCIVPLAVSHLMEQGFVRLIVVCITAFISLCAAAYAIGMNREEKNYLLGFVREKLKRR